MQKEDFRMKPNKAFTMVTLMVAMLAAVAANAGSNAPGSDPGIGPCEALWDKLSLDQRSRTISLCSGFRSQVDDLRSSIWQRKIEVMDLLSKSIIDDSAIRMKRQEILALQDKIRDEREATLARVRALITYGQRKPAGPFDTGMAPPGSGPWWAQ
jgi:hypothetical protein